ncbi:hypothetical protein A2G94_02000 [Francisella endosymbiont of Ornithodoros moubata]|uniref:hypothetical protein n=1 Tax=Francisella-like endosymbiont TaxID=512373 RepID=UPI000A23F376|nr:hypothetical protein A2G94_02000 [Francisella endosymbiont of Ornithodoros moubata]
MQLNQNILVYKIIFLVFGYILIICDYISIEQLINIFRKLNKSDKFSLAIELADGSVTQKTVDISYGYDYDYVPTL